MVVIVIVAIGRMREGEAKVGVLDMPLNEFILVVTNTAHPKWYEIGLELKIKLNELEGLKHNNLHRCDTYRLDALLHTYYKMKRDTKKMREAVLRACIYAGIEGSLRDAIQKEGYSWTF